MSEGSNTDNLKGKLNRTLAPTPASNSARNVDAQCTSHLHILPTITRLPLVVIRVPSTYSERRASATSNTSRTPTVRWLGYERCSSSDRRHSFLLLFLVLQSSPNIGRLLLSLCLSFFSSTWCKGLLTGGNLRTLRR